MTCTTDDIARVLKGLRRVILKHFVECQLLHYAIDDQKRKDFLQKGVQAGVKYLQSKDVLKYVSFGIESEIEKSSRESLITLHVNSDVLDGTEYDASTVRCCPLVRVTFKTRVAPNTCHIHEIRSMFIVTDGTRKIFSYDSIRDAHGAPCTYLARLRYSTDGGDKGRFNLSRELYPAVVDFVNPLQHNKQKHIGDSIPRSYWLNGQLLPEFFNADNPTDDSPEHEYKMRFAKLPHKMKVFEWNMRGL